MTSRKNSQRRTRFTAVVVVSILLIVGLIAWIAIARNAGGGDFVGAGEGEEQIVEIPEGSNISALGPELEEKGIVKSDGAFQSAAMANQDSNNIQPGFYRLKSQMSAGSAVEALLNPSNRVTPLQVYGGATLMDITVVGGKTRPGIYSMIEAVSCGDTPKSGCVTVEDLQSVAATIDPAELGVPSWATQIVAARSGDPKRLEGLIAPGDYIIDPGADAKTVLSQLIGKSTREYETTGIDTRANAVGLSPYELLAAASLVEREAPEGEFDKVARVILNRLDRTLRLEFDSTVNYDLPTVEVATGDSARDRRTSWNTYAMDGLPETPISSPSIEAIVAMEEPAEGNWLFFVTVDDQGTTVFNDTFEQHLEDSQRAYDSGLLDSQR